MSEANIKKAGHHGEAAEQVILPWRMALRITLRGLKIRLGRSIITMSGVVLGIAFLMSVLTGEGLRSGLADENRIRTEVMRLFKLVEDEVGSLERRKVSILISGRITDARKLRLLERMARAADQGAIRVFQTAPDRLSAAGGRLQPELRGPAFEQITDIDAFFQDSHVVLLLHRQLPQMGNEQLARYLATMVQPVMLDYYHGRYSERALQQISDKILYSSLSYRMSPEEAAKAERLAQRMRARRIWITIVSMLVTLIGIWNAMLMSVTERIREIGTMKCLGALSGFVVKLFLIESLIVGTLGAIIGTLLGFVVPFVAYMLSSGIDLLLRSTPFGQLVLYGLASILAGTILALVAAISPGWVAAKMVPADALRTNV